MPNNSSVPAVKGALFDLLTATLPTTQVTWAGHAVDWARESAWMGQANFDTEEIAALRSATNPHNEIYTVAVVLMATKEGNNPQATEARGFELAALVEDAIRQARTMGGTNVHWVNVVGKEAELFTRDSGWVAFVTLVIGVQARI